MWGDKLPDAWPSMSLRVLDLSYNEIGALPASLYAQWWCGEGRLQQPCVQLEGNPCVRGRLCREQLHALMLPRWQSGDSTSGTIYATVNQNSCGVVHARVCVEDRVTALGGSREQHSQEPTLLNKEGQRIQACIRRAKRVQRIQCVCA